MSLDGGGLSVKEGAVLAEPSGILSVYPIKLDLNGSDIPLLRMRSVRLLAALACLGLAASPPVPAEDADPVEGRVAALLARMTLEEKVGQLNLASAGPLFLADQVRAGQVGSVINFNSAEMVREAQGLARQSRLGIPLLVGLDVVHGFRTTFPVPIAEAATFDPALAHLASEWAAREASAAGVTWTFGPMADISYDPRWGRNVEGAGEDTFMGRRFTAARVEGFKAGGLMTSVKHFAGYGAAVGGRDYDATPIPPADLRDHYLPPFRAGIEAGAESVMAAFNAIDGVPSHASPWLLTEVLRNEWGFSGLVVSDWAGIQELIAHGVAADGPEATRKAFLAGIDVDLGGEMYHKHLADEVRAGRVPLAAVDDAVRRMLRVKWRLGLFDRPDPTPEGEARAVVTPEARAAARRIARESFVLLQNRDAVLPLRAGPQRIAVVGPLADASVDQMGPHAARGHDDDVVTFLEGLRRRAGEAGATIVHEAGCALDCVDASGFEAAVRAAEGADMVVAVLGEPRALSGEAASRAHLGLTHRQPELLQRLAATGKPVILVLMSGRPLELKGALEAAKAVLMVWYPGTEGGPALADVLFGDADPGGRLPMSYPRTVGQAPIHYNRAPTGRPHRPDNRYTLNYVDESHRPLFPFGFGLSYGRFAYSDLAVRTPRLRASDTLEVTVALTNVGERAGSEVAQLYVRDPVASRSRPVRELKGFQKVVLQPGERRVLTFRVPARELGFHLADGAYVVEPGRFEVYAGGDAEATLAGAFEVIEGLRMLPGVEQAAMEGRQPARKPRTTVE